jgi:glycosyltransferase involved in cell wall biosynthesis
MPTVSIIIPTYNRTDYLTLTLESIAKQTYQDYEIIVVDDGTLGGENERICSRFEKLKYIKIENSGGPAKPRNIGILKASGKYIAFVDDDDIWLPHKLEKQVKVLDDNSEFGLVHSCCEVINEKDVLQKQIVGRPRTPDVKHGDISTRMIGNWTIMMPTPLLRAEVVKQVGFFNEKMTPATEDVEYWSRCSFETKFYYIDEPLARYRIHSNNISASKEKYRKLPFYLKEVLLDKRREKRISRTTYKKNISSMCINQINYIRDHYGITLAILFELDKFWFLRLKNFKCLIFNVLFKKYNKRV